MTTTTTYNAGTVGSTPYSNSTFLNANFDNDVYRIRVNSATSLNLNLHNISAGDDADLYLYRDSNNNGVWDASDQLVASSRRGSNFDDSINYRADAGNYLARVNRYSTNADGRLTYELDISGNSPSNLLPVEVNGGSLGRGSRTYNDFVGNNDTADVYKFTLAQASNVNVRLTGLSSDADVRIIRDFDNDQIVDAGEVIRTSTLGGTSSENINFSLPGSTPFYVEVYQFSGNTNYQLQMNVT